MKNFQIYNVCVVVIVNQTPFCRPASGDGMQGSNNLVVTSRPKIGSETSKNMSMEEIGDSHYVALGPGFEEGYVPCM